MTTSDLDIREIYKSKFLSGDDLRGSTLTCVIRRAGLQTLPTDDGGMEDKIKLLLEPIGAVAPEVRQAFRKPCVICKTEANKVSGWLNQPLAARWIGAEVTVYPVKGRFFGKPMTVPRFKSARWSQERRDPEPRRRDDEPPPREPGED